MIKDIIGAEKYEKLFSNGRNKILLCLLEDKTFEQNFLTQHFQLTQKLDKTDIFNLIKVCINWYNASKQDTFWLGEDLILYSDDYKIDLNGYCLDGDPNCIRYINKKTNKVYKMKTSKFLHKVTEDIPIPKAALHWFAEVFAEKRKSEVLKISDNFVLKFGNSLEDFYTIYKDDQFNSCMHGGKHISFYKNCVNASAAWLENKQGEVVSRCIIFNKVYDESGNLYRLAERQYSDQDYLKEILILKLIEKNLIDGFKKVGAGASHATWFLRNDGTSMQDLTLSIDCDLKNHDIISYQDSFKYYFDINKKAYNKPFFCDLDTTDLYYLYDDAEETFSYLVAIQNTRIEVTYHEAQPDEYEYNNTKYIGNYEIIDGEKVPKEKIISQYTKNNVFIARYKDVTKAAEKLGKSERNIHKCAIGKQQTAYNYIWKYDYGYNIDLSDRPNY